MRYGYKKPLCRDRGQYILKEREAICPEDNRHPTSYGQDLMAGQVYRFLLEHRSECGLR